MHRNSEPVPRLGVCYGLNLPEPLPSRPVAKAAAAASYGPSSAEGTSTGQEPSARNSKELVPVSGAERAKREWFRTRSAGRTREHLAKPADSRLRTTTRLHVPSLHSLPGDAADALEMSLKNSWEKIHHRLASAAGAASVTFLISFPHEWSRRKLDINFTLSFTLLCTCSFHTPSQERTLRALPKLHPVQGPRRAAAALHGELEPPFLFRKFRTMEIKFLSRIQPHPPLDRILPLVCSGRRSSKDRHSSPREETLAAEKRLWSAGLPAAEARAGRAGRADAFERVNSQER